MEKINFTEVIKNKHFKTLWTNQILLQLSYNILNFTLLIWVFRLTGSNIAVSALMLATYLPGVLFGIISGIIADRADKRRIVLFTDLTLAMLFLVFLFSKTIFVPLLINTFLVNSLVQFFMPSESSAIPTLVDKKHMFLANSLFSLTLYGSIIVGFTLGGPIYRFFGINTIFLLGAILLTLAYLLSHNLPAIPASISSDQVNHPLDPKTWKWLFNLTIEETKETVAFMRGRISVIAAIGLLSTIQGIIGVLAVVLPSYMERVLRIHATDSSYIVMFPLGLGMVMGAYLVGKFFHNRPRRSLVIPSIIGAGLVFLIIGSLPTFVQLLGSRELPLRVYHLRPFSLVPSLSAMFSASAFLLGLFTVSIVIPSQTVLQENTNDKNRGKIFAVLSVFMTSFAAIPVFLTGILSDIFGVTPVFFSLGIAVLFLGILALYPHLFFEEEHLPFKIREFLGLSHWAKE